MIGVDIGTLAVRCQTKTLASYCQSRAVVVELRRPTMMEVVVVSPRRHYVQERSMCKRRSSLYWYPHYLRASIHPMSAGHVVSQSHEKSNFSQILRQCGRVGVEPVKLISIQTHTAGDKYFVALPSTSDLQLGFEDGNVMHI